MQKGEGRPLGLGRSESEEWALRKGTLSWSWMGRAGSPETVPPGDSSQLGHVRAVSRFLPQKVMTGLVSKSMWSTSMAYLLRHPTTLIPVASGVKVSFS